MRIKWEYFFLFFAVTGCKNNADQAAENDLPLHSEPLTVLLNLSGGYTVNLLTGDSIKPIINSSGDTIKTGVPISFIGKNIDFEEKYKSAIINPVTLVKKIIASNIHPVPANLKTIPFDTTLLKKIKLGEGDQSFILRNCIGTVPTGIPIPVTGKKIPVKEPRPVRADVGLPRLRVGEDVW